MQLDIFERKRGFLQHIDLTSGRLEMHDLCMEFAEKEVSGTFNKLDVFENEKWMQMDVDNPLMKTGRNWSKVTCLLVIALEPKLEDLEILRDWNLQYFLRVGV